MSSSAIYSLRDAKVFDLEFLFGVIIAVRESKKMFNWNEEFQSFKKSDRARNNQVVVYHNRNVGRLRVDQSQSSSCIYVGGIQILPAFQSKGIGAAIFGDLIQESERTGLPISLEVFTENESAFRFYTRLGFVEEGANNFYRQLIRVPTV